MNTFANLYSRRTVRTYTGEAITPEQEAEILKAAQAAPIGRRRYDTLAISVITNADFITRWEQRVSEMNKQPDSHPFYGAPTVILVSSEIMPPPSDNVNYSNAAIVVHNMAIAATELGVGACHIWGAVRTLQQTPDLIKELRIPEGFIPCCAIALGKTEEIYTLREIPERIATDFLR